MSHICIVDKAYDPWAVVAAYERDHLSKGRCGAAAVFTGSMRDFNQGDSVSDMTLEHYPGMTEKHLANIADAATVKHELDDVMIQHRVGSIKPGDTIVLVAVWSAHRKAAFIACREIMEDLKSKAPFWKKETLIEVDNDNPITEKVSAATRWVDKNTPG